MNSERLIKLAEYLRLINEKHFDLDYVIAPSSSPNDEVLKNLKEISKSHKPLDCKTAACAVGFCPGVFKESHWGRDKYGELTVMFSGIDDYGIIAAREFFDLTPLENSYLFIPDYYPEGKRKAKDVAARIEYCARFGFPDTQAIKDYYNTINRDAEDY